MKLSSGVTVILDKNVTNKFEIFKRFNDALNFPDYFGENWDAFVDMMRDLSWLKVDQIQIIVDQMPKLPEKDQRILSKTLERVDADNLSSTERPDVAVDIYFTDDFFQYLKSKNITYKSIRSS